MPIIPADRLTNIGSTLLQAAGASKAEGDTVAKGCVAANLAGHDSHGVIAIPTYIDRMGKGHIVPGAPFEIKQESATTTVIDGNWGFGFVVAEKAAQISPWWYGGFALAVLVVMLLITLIMGKGRPHS